MKAIDAYAKLVPHEIPILCFDDTFFGSAKDGFLVTTHGIHIHNQTDTSAKFVSFKDVESITLNEGFARSELVINGEIKDLAWKKTFISKSVQYQRDVVPIHFIGQNSNFFYRLANFSDKYIKKVNVAMIYLVDEMYKNVGKTFTIRFGKPIPWQTFDKTKTPAEWAQYVKERVYEL